MRNMFVKTLIDLARVDERIYLMTGDLGFMVMEPFRSEFGHRFINAGVQEANMIGMAAGLAAAGKIPFVYSIVPFIALRAVEHIRNDICYHYLNVRLVGVGGGYSYGIMGPTHHALEDIAVMKSLSNMTVICPGDPLEVEAAVKTSVDYKGPIYLRLGKAGEPILHSQPLSFRIGLGNIVMAGDDLTLIATGNMLETAVHVAYKLKALSLSARVVSMHTVVPLDEKLVLQCAQETSAIFTLEEHHQHGLGSSVAMVLAQASIKNYTFHPFSARRGYADRVGSQDYLRKEDGLDPESIVNRILQIKGKRPNEK